MLSCLALSMKPQVLTMTRSAPSGSGASVAGLDLQRRYLFDVPSADGRRDSIVYRIGLAEQAIIDGASDPLANNPAALWTLEDAGNGYYYVRNQQSGAYMVIDNYLSAAPATIYPRYAKHDNGHAAFFLDADGLGGPLAIFALHADRTRLRWVIEQTAVAPIVTGIAAHRPAADATPRYVSLQGITLAAPPRRGIYIHRYTAPDGSVVTRKIAVGK